MSKHILIKDDGSAVVFDPSEWAWMPTKADLEVGRYEPKFGPVTVDGDKATQQITQEWPPLVRLRGIR